jgi:hypothetical protein
MGRTITVRRCRWPAGTVDDQFEQMFAISRWSPHNARLTPSSRGSPIPSGHCPWRKSGCCRLPMPWLRCWPDLGSGEVSRWPSTAGRSGGAGAGPRSPPRRAPGSPRSACPTWGSWPPPRLASSWSGFPWCQHCPLIGGRPLWARCLRRWTSSWLGRLRTCRSGRRGGWRPWRENGAQCSSRSAPAGHTRLTCALGPSSVAGWGSAGATGTCGPARRG